MQIDALDIDSNWIKFSTITTPQNDVNYYIQNRGNGNLLACESSLEPTNEDGIVVRPHEVLKYKKGAQDLYLKSISFPVLSNLGSEKTQFNQMLSGVSGCTVHFPASLESTLSSWEDVQSGFSGIDTVIVYDL